ncbi:hypothetical protein LY90DRAFT_675866 [Neocallimastix californiae]|uniref:Uncharacterized protein n=1 Tax=Neocallimastix californiae TaxID=1754190 RepID=A0A1Y2AJ03_9FUNG|nr:hypothetical protein LY90DRAFT_675866 [Neocallimastix californiae]|eukprot:ORY22474.1 hypothetical protein LY90DRAFT_675866 [Neocallimastix californiae]
MQFKIILFLNYIIIFLISNGYSIKNMKCLKNTIQYEETYRQETVVTKNHIDMISTLQCDNFNKTLEITGYPINAVFLTNEISIKDAIVEILPFNEMGIPKIEQNKDCPFLIEAFYRDKYSSGIAHIAWSLKMRHI